MSSFSYSESESFTVVHARKLAAKVTTDLHQCRLFYGQPSADMVTQYRDELEVLLAGRYVAEYEFGFERSGQRVLSWRYSVRADGSLQGDDGAGTIDPTLSVSGRAWHGRTSANPAASGLSSNSRSAEPRPTRRATVPDTGSSRRRTPRVA
jgi:hypothetical protein